jgi:hypothetical protein
LFPSLVRGRDNNQPPGPGWFLRAVGVVSSGGGLDRPSVSWPAVPICFFLFLVCLEGRCSFNVQVLPSGVDWATNLAASPMVGVVEQLGRWMCWGSDGRMRQSGLPASSCALEGWKVLSVFPLFSRVPFAKGWSTFVMLLFHLVNAVPLCKKNITMTVDCTLLLLGSTTKSYLGERYYTSSSCCSGALQNSTGKNGTANHGINLPTKQGA